ncbi:MAG: GTP-binding protein, partial [Pseudomonadota bacterium]
MSQSETYQNPKAPLPVTIIGGYLGAGKTTLINHLLRNADGKKLAILVNEFGELPIDADLIEAQDDKLISLSGGCVCCSFGNDLMAAMTDLQTMEPRPDHIVLEASGVAIPSMIAGSISIMNGYRLDGTLVMVDALNIRNLSKDIYLSDTVARQLTDSDIVILNKADLVDGEELTAVGEWAGQISENAKLLPATNAKVPLNVALQNFDRLLSAQGGHHHLLDGYVTQSIEMTDQVDPLEFAESLLDENPDLVRAKVFV